MMEVEYVGGMHLSSVLKGHSLFCHQWRHSDSSHQFRAMLYLCHGVTEHTLRYKTIAEYLVRHDVLVFGHDHALHHAPPVLQHKINDDAQVGHGQSEGERVYVDSIGSYVLDVIQHIDEMKSRHPSLPCFLMGHSMGGLIAAHVVVQRLELVQGLILSSTPSAHVYRGPLRAIKHVVRLLSAIAPHKPLIPWDASVVSSLPAKVAEFVADPLVYHGWVRFSWVNAMIVSMDALEDCWHAISLPVLLIHGTEDSMVSISSSEHIYQAISTTDKIFEVFPGNYHEVLNDCGCDKAIRDIGEWILNHIT